MDAKGVIFGLTFAHGKKEIIRGIMEGIALEEKVCIKAFNEIGFNIEDIIVLGGGSRSDLWNQIKADVTDIKVHKPQKTQAASLGAMVLAGIGLGLLSDPKITVQEVNPIDKIYYPSRENVPFYENIYLLYQEFYRAAEPFFNHLSVIN